MSAYNGQGWPVFNREEDCSYLFDWDTKYACLDHPVIEECRVNHNGKRFDLSPLVKHTGIYVIDIYAIIVSQLSSFEFKDCILMYICNKKKNSD